MAEWNIRQREIEEAHERARRGRGRSSGRKRRAMSPRAAIAALAKAPQVQTASPEAASFWLTNGLLHVS